ncbi:MAG: hypothetical protein F4X60_11880 [Gemmatimonadetes bacterium]|nr:hypothetical protein [Gemmatimonadota bacterium]
MRSNSDAPSITRGPDRSGVCRHRKTAHPNPAGVAGARRSILVSAFGLLLLLPACNPDRPSPLTTPVLRDSADIRIAENPRPAEGSRLGWQIGPEPTVTIGAAEGGDHYLLNRVGRSVTLSDGSIVVPNGVSNEVRVFDAEGLHLRSWGGFGDGPGEFDELHAVARWRGDSVAAWDQYPHRGVSIFDSEGNLGRVVALGMGQPDRSITILRGGAFMADHWLRREQGAGLLVQEQVFEIRDADGVRIASLDPLIGREFFEFQNRGMPVWMDIAFSRRVYVAAWRDLAVVSRNDRYELRGYEADGRLRQIIRVDHTPIPVTESLIELRREERGGGVQFDQMPHPETLPAFTTIMSDALDHLWVREYDVPGEEGRHRLWTVFDPEGRVLGYVEMPEGMVMDEIGADYVLGRRLGERGVVQVALRPHFSYPHLRAHEK